MVEVLVGEAGEGEVGSKELAEVGVVGEAAEQARVGVVVEGAGALTAEKQMVAVVEALAAVEELISKQKMQQLAKEVAYYV